MRDLIEAAEEEVTVREARTIGFGHSESRVVRPPMRAYEYVGPPEIRKSAIARAAGHPIGSVADVEAWISGTGQVPESSGWIAVTFVVDETGALRLADRRSEHVACAGGGRVLSAGEIFFARSRRGRLEVVEVSNQSTGYCPEPSSWPAVAEALERVGIAHPGRFTTVLTFRRCDACGERNIVKDGWSCCEICRATLPAEWNFGPPRP